MATKNRKRPNTKTKTIDFRSLVNQIDPGRRAPHISYAFSKRIFRETDRDGVYNDKPN